MELIGTLTPEQEMWVNNIENLYGFQRSFATTPGIPEERLQFLRDAFSKVTNNPEVQAIAAKAERPMQYLDGAEVAKRIEDILGMPADKAQDIKNVIFEKYSK